jgi:hypothetical protein
MEKDPYPRNGAEHWFSGTVVISAKNQTIEHIVIAARDRNDAMRRFEGRARLWTLDNAVCKKAEMMMPFPGETFEEQKQRLSKEGFLII